MKLIKARTRYVFVLNKVVIKIPSLKNWKQFKLGLAANRSEYKNFKVGSKYFIPILFSLPYGFLTIMRKADRVLDWDDEKESIFISFLKELSDDIDDFFLNAVELAVMDNFGIYEGKVVCLDYPTVNDAYLNLAIKRELIED